MFNKVMKVVERVCFFLIPGSYIVIEVLSSFFPKFSNSIDIKGYLIALSCQIVLFFAYFDEKNNTQPLFSRSEHLIYDLVSIVKKKHFSEVKILAVNGYHYHRAIKEGNCKIDKLTLLLRAPNLETIAFPTEKDHKKELIESTRQLVERWKELQINGLVSELQILFYDFDTTLHFMILDEETLFWGLLYPISKFPGSEVLPVYTVKDFSNEGKKMIRDFSIKMEMIKQEKTLTYCDFPYEH